MRAGGAVNRPRWWGSEQDEVAGRVRVCVWEAALTYTVLHGGGGGGSWDSFRAL